ncbi:MAG: oleate hydratase [Bacilli bacterium]|nr:oleate hydratase [Bacilli bacterium]
MYYSAGNYEAFAHPEKPEGSERKHAYVIGSGLAGLSAAFFLVRDGGLKGENVRVLEKLPVSGGSCDGLKDGLKGYYMRGGREMDNHFECMWDLFRDVPSLETPGVSVLDEYYWLNKKDPNYSLCRVTERCGHDAHTDRKFGLSKKAALEIMKLYMTPEKDLEDKKISDFFDDEFWNSNFWIYWQTMFAFQRWCSALEMKRYMQRFVHHIDGLPDLSALKFTKYNQYESMILPLQKYLESRGVVFDFGIEVTNVEFAVSGQKKVAKKLEFLKEGKTETKELSEDDLVIITNGCCTDVSRYGDQKHAPDLSRISPNVGDSWNLWNKIAAQDPSFGNPAAFASDPEATNWMSATIETKDPAVIRLIEAICHRNPLEGKVTTGGIVTVKDSRDNWFLSWTVNRQPQFKAQDKSTVLIWVYSLSTNKPGNFVKKPMRECSGEEICQEWLYHIGMPVGEIAKCASKKCNTTTCYMPYINAFFQPRKNTDRPRVVPEGAVNFAFVGQFAETPRDTIFTTEYSIRTGMEAAYTLMKVDRGIPEVWGSTYDVRELLKASYHALDGKKIEEIPLSWKEKILLKKVRKAAKGTDAETIMKNSGLF